MVEDPMTHLTIDWLECVVGGRDMVLYFSMCLKAETQELPVICVI